MAGSAPAMRGESSPRRTSAERLVHAIGIALAVLLWAITLALLARRSREPVVLHRYSHEYATLLVCVLIVTLAATIAQVPRVYARLYAQRHALLWWLVICPLIGVMAVEGAMRTFNLWGSDFYGDIREYMGALVLDPQLAFRNPVNYHHRFHGFVIDTNAIGLRDRPLEPHRAETTRILVLGDSVAFGWGVDVDDAFPRQLERELGQRAAEPVETINSGVVGYNTSQELTFLRLYDARLQPDLVLLLYVDNDVDAIDPARVKMDVLPSPWRDPLGATDYFLSMSRVYFMLRQMIPGVLRAASGSAGGGETSGGWKESMAALREMADFCRAHHLPLVVVHFRMLDDPLSHRLNGDLEAASRKAGFVFADALPWYRGLNYRRLINSFIDSHPNAAGHRVLADGMAKVVLAHGLVPAAPAASAAPGK